MNFDRNPRGRRRSFGRQLDFELDEMNAALSRNRELQVAPGSVMEIVNNSTRVVRPNLVYGRASANGPVELAYSGARAMLVALNRAEPGKMIQALVVGPAMLRVAPGITSADIEAAPLLWVANEAPGFVTPVLPAAGKRFFVGAPQSSKIDKGFIHAMVNLMMQGSTR